MALLDNMFSLCTYSKLNTSLHKQIHTSKSVCVSPGLAQSYSGLLYYKYKKITE